MVVGVGMDVGVGVDMGVDVGMGVVGVVVGVCMVVVVVVVVVVGVGVGAWGKDNGGWRSEEGFNVERVAQEGEGITDDVAESWQST